MSDAHLRPELRAQNPLYNRAGNVRLAFEQERCPLHARVVTDQNKTEAQRRHSVIARREQHIVAAETFEALIQKRKPSMIEQEQPSPVLRPSWAGRTQPDRQKHFSRLKKERERASQTQTFQPHSHNKENNMSDAPQDRSNKQGQAPDIVLTDGALKAASWREDGEYGPFFNTKITRRYTDKEGDVRETSTLRERDLLPAAELAGEVHRTIREHKREHTQQRDHTNTQDHAHSENWHDDTKTRKEVKRDRFKQDRSESGTRRPRKQTQTQ